MNILHAILATALSLFIATGCSTGVSPNDAATFDGSTNCALSGSYTYGNNGGWSPAVPATLSPRANWSPGAIGSEPPARTCVVPCAADGASVNVEAVNAALANGDVVAALESATPPVYGVDNRQVDGTAWTFTRSSDGHSFTVGSDCGTTPGCVAIPPGVAALRDLLRQLDVQEGMRVDCVSP